MLDPGLDSRLLSSRNFASPGAFLGVASFFARDDALFVEALVIKDFLVFYARFHVKGAKGGRRIFIESVFDSVSQG